MPAESARLCGLSVRVKLTLSYAGLVVVAAIALFAVGLLVLRFVPEGNLVLDSGGYVPSRANFLAVFVKYAWWAIAGLAVLGLVGGWLLAGLVLKPLDRITEAARLARDGSFRHRIDLPGRRDELTDLADTFDAMLARVQRTVEEERRFAANASHELRTPHAIIRTMVEVAQADPDGRDVDVLLDRVASTNDRAIAITEALLTLARVGQGAGIERSPVALADAVADAVADEQVVAAARGVTIEVDAQPATVVGERTLLQRLVANLVHNAVVHNVEGGRARVEVAPVAGGALLEVRNTGPVIDPALAATLAEPFVRGAGRVRGPDETEGSGLGLAIASAIVRAHDGTLAISARAEGGLAVRVTLPAR
jgi:two-component system, OmpR family, sensor histidine kinase VanS